MRKLESNLLALMAGVAIGALAGVLLAPDKGEKTRERIADGSARLRRDMEDKASELKRDIARKSAELKKELDEQLEVSKTKLTKFAEGLVVSAKETLANGKKAEITDKA
ncbi:YtxH domain-containing protein [Rhodoflexus caldus]|uniref:YtxH domain-containing protein n=1 Tax=Rhodoflexus caldus TaxID=2891236 RepID=UPI002029EDCF|nr:YtxH domain-containing protein [Rhodoflexus caldus]